MNDMSPPTRTPVETLLFDRYRGDLPATGAWNTTLDLLLAHRTVRAFLPDAPPPHIVETLVAAAQSASSSSNLQSWSVIAVEDPARKARLAGFAANQSHIHEAPLLMIWLADLNRLGQVATSIGQPSEALSYLEAFLFGVADAAIAAQNAVIALESLGLGSCYIGAMRNRPLDVAAELRLPPNVFALFGLAIGYPDPSRPASVKPRLPQKAVLFREQYGFDSTKQDAVSDYNERMRAFQHEQGMTEQDWSTQASTRVRDGDALSGRHVLSDTLRKLGFGLK